ncbi:MAG: hypothetical protein IJK60_05060 [Clostridia bacterium]|nr:hypothetical protein [Clostridia bacterium]
MKNVLSIFTVISLIFTYIFGLGEITTSQGYELTRSEKLAPTVSMFAGQGLCCDGEFFYTSGSMTGVGFTGLAKFDLNMKCLKRVMSAIPDEFKTSYQSDHIGGIDCFGGKIYAAVEGDGYKYNFVLVYDCKTLEYTGEYYNLTSEYLTDGIPWLAVDGENKLLYTSKFSDVGEILVYDLESMQLTDKVELSRTVDRIQGGSVYEGILYLSYDADDSTDEQVLAVNLETGAVSVEFERHLPNYDNEAEDICVYPLSDGTLFHIIDYDKLICSNIRHYSLSS